MDLTLPNTALLKKSLWSSVSLKDGLYALCLIFMLMNQHFNNEERITKLEDSNIQLAAMMKTMNEESVPRKEYDATLRDLNVHLGRIDQGQSNLMTYLLDHPK